MLQSYLFEYTGAGKHRTAQKLKLILNCIFDLAAEDFNIKSPVKKIVLPYHESKKGSAFTKAEERKLVDYCIANPDGATTSAMLVLLYFGLRQCELQSLQIIDGKFLDCITGKERLGRKETHRQIPITPVARRVLPYIDFEKAKNTNPDSIRTLFTRLFPNHHPHELRYTFITRCKECGVNHELVMLWDGHKDDKEVKTSKVDRGYTDYSEEYVLSEAEKVNYEF
jgi:integrase